MTMARLEGPIKVNLPDDWVERVIDRMKEDPDFILVTHCADCNSYIRHDHRCGYWNHGVSEDDFCSRAEERPE